MTDRPMDDLMLPPLPERCAWLRHEDACGDEVGPPDALYTADQMINAGDAEVVIAGGMESMTNAPYLLPKARAGYRMGNGQLVDSLIHDGLWCAFDAVHMGEGTEKYTGALGGITREAQDDMAA